MSPERLAELRQYGPPGTGPDDTADLVREIARLTAERDALAVSLQQHRVALVNCAVPLEALNASERGGIALCESMQDEIASAVEGIRAVILASCPQAALLAEIAARKETK